jgi:hypothetical protein
MMTLRDEWTVVSAAAVIASSWIVAGVYLDERLAERTAPDLTRIIETVPHHSDSPGDVSSAQCLLGRWVARP